MAGRMTLLVGTVGQGIMRSADNGETWRRVSIDQGIHSDALVRCLANHPSRPELVHAGTDKGLYRSEDSGETWRLVPSPLSDYCVWAIAIDPVEPERMYAGTGGPSRATIFRSADGGSSWEQRPVEVAEECPAVGVPRVTGIAIDPEDRRNVWVGLEVDGVRRSTDGGDTWTSVNGGIPNLDVHNVAVAAGPPKTVVVVVNNDVYTSSDDGATLELRGSQRSLSLGVPTGHHGATGQPQGGVSHHRRHNARPHGHSHAVEGRRPHLGEPPAARTAELCHVGGKRAGLRFSGGPGGQPLRVPLP